MRRRTGLLAMAALVASGGVERRVDLGRVDDAWFANVAGFGFDVAVLHASKRIPLLRGPAVYVAAAVHELFGYAGLDAKLEGTGESPPQWQRRPGPVVAQGPPWLQARTALPLRAAGRAFYACKLAPVQGIRRVT